MVAKSGNRLTHIANGQVKTDANAPLAERLVTLDRELTDVIARFDDRRWKGPGLQSLLAR